MKLVYITYFCLFLFSCHPINEREKIEQDNNCPAFLEKYDEYKKSVVKAEAAIIEKNKIKSIDLINRMFESCLAVVPHTPVKCKTAEYDMPVTYTFENIKCEELRLKALEQAHKI